MTKKTPPSENIFRRIRLPKRDEMFAVVMEMSGGSRLKALCADNKTRMVRIGGKLKRRMWCRQNDLIIVKPWVVQTDIKADLVYRYLPTERNKVLSRLPKELLIW